MKLLILFATSMLALTLLCQPTFLAQTPAPTPVKKITPTQVVKPPAPQDKGRAAAEPSLADKLSGKNLPDLWPASIEFGYSKDSTDRPVRVAVVNLNNVNVKKPFKVWLRIWKPTDEKSVQDPTLGKTSFLWSGLLTADGVAAKGTKELIFTVNTQPPGGWRFKCYTAPFECYRWTEDVTDPLRLRWQVRVDPSNEIREGDESNNQYPKTQPIWGD